MRRFACALVAAATIVGVAPPAAADPNALWTIVHDQCEPSQVQHGDPGPCAEVDLAGGYAVLKDLVGATQFLLIPTARIDGIESPELLAPEGPNYFAAAWRARRFVEQRAGVALSRDWISLAINSADARTQNQLHIHVDCVRADVRDALQRNISQLRSTWSPFPDPLVGQRYDATLVAGSDLDALDPFISLADGVPGARADMGAQTLAAVGVYLPDGNPGFVLLATSERPAHAEDLQDHDTCPPREALGK